VPLLAAMPTVAELGYPGYQSGNWYGILVPAKTPREIIAALRATTLNALGSAGLSKRLADLGYVTIGDTPEEFAAHIRGDIAALGRVLRDLNVPAN
jgi:tripartite-type tricarboxylate transporter receptor subunit TctC